MAQATESNVELTVEPIARNDEPVPLSFPAILRNSGGPTPYAHLRSEISASSAPVRKTTKRINNEGKRWVRRRENAQFTGNPYVVQASKADYKLQLPRMKATFPEPLPAYLPRTAKLPDTVKPALEPQSANAGRFSLSLKGMRRDLRKAGFRAQLLVQDVEHELNEWLVGGVYAAPTNNPPDSLDFPGTPVGRMNVIYEVSRSPLQLIWSVTDDAFARYVVHCCARYHEIVSFSKEESGRRLTYLLRPNSTRPDPLAVLGVDTPPTTDFDSSSHFETDPESDVVSEVLADNLDSDAESPLTRGNLPAISEATLPPTPDSPWSIVDMDDSDLDEFAEGDVTLGLESLSIQPSSEPRQPLPSHIHTPLRSRQWSIRQDRSASSPSRSPARRTPRRRIQRRYVSIHQKSNLSFYDYLFT